MTLDPTSLAAVLEPSAVDRNYAFDAFPGAADLVQTSQAISLKRIADALERHFTPINTLAETPGPLERIAESLDTIAALLAAPAALKATGVELLTIGIGTRLRDPADKSTCVVYAVRGEGATKEVLVEWDAAATPALRGETWWAANEFEVIK